MSVPPHMIAEYDQGRAILSRDLDALIGGYRQRAALDGQLAAHVATHSVLNRTFPAESLALLLSEAIARLATPGPGAAS